MQGRVKAISRRTGATKRLVAASVIVAVFNIVVGRAKESKVNVAAAMMGPRPSASNNINNAMHHWLLPMLSLHI